MILENKIIQALRFFGPMTADQIIEKLKMIGVTVEVRDVELAMSGLERNKYVRSMKTKKRLFTAQQEDL